jgi:hypothetical protein
VVSVSYYLFIIFMTNKITITDPGEIHLLLVEKYQRSSVNVVVRAVLNRSFPLELFGKSAFHLVTKHPYLNARYYISKFNKQFLYFYEELDEYLNNIELISSSDECIHNLMNTLSNMRTYLFDHASGELYKIKAYMGETRCMVELTVSHIVGEIPSALLLMGDYLQYLDNCVSDIVVPLNTNQKYFFNEKDFGWNNCEYQDIVFEVNHAYTLTQDPWTMPAAVLRRHMFPNDLFQDIQNWLSSRKIKAKVSDMFYYVASAVLDESLGRSPELWLILNYRNKSNLEYVKNGIYNFAFFSPVNSALFDNTSIKSWLESFQEYSNHLITRDGVCQTRSLFNSLNKAMQGTELEHGKAIMNSYVKLPDFAFNNLGRIDHYIGTFENFSLSDIDVQDGTPVQEIRYFSLNNVIYFNPTFFIDDVVDVDKFWDAFLEKIDRIKGTT